MTDLSPRQKTQEAYASYFSEVAEANAVQESFSATKEPLKRRWSNWGGNLAALGVAGFLTSGLVEAVDGMVGVDANDSTTLLVAMVSLGAGIAGGLTSGLNVASVDSHNHRIFMRKRNASSRLMNAVVNEISSYGLVILDRKDKGHYVLTNKGVVTLATDESDKETVHLLLDGKVLQPSYYTESRMMETLDGQRINAPEVVKI